MQNKKWVERDESQIERIIEFLVKENAINKDCKLRGLPFLNTNKVLTNPYVKIIPDTFYWKSSISNRTDEPAFAIFTNLCLYNDKGITRMSVLDNSVSYVCSLDDEYKEIIHIEKYNTTGPKEKHYFCSNSSRRQDFVGNSWIYKINKEFLDELDVLTQFML